MNRVEFSNSIPIKQVYEDFTGTKIDDKDGSDTILCHFHKDTKPSMKLYLDRNKFKCFGCGAYGGPIDFVLDTMYNGSEDHFIDVVNLLCEKYHYVGEDKRGPKVSQFAINKAAYCKDLEGLSIAFNNNLNTLESKDDYFSVRGISVEVQNKYLLSYCNPIYTFRKDANLTNLIQAGLTDNAGANCFADRWIIPIRDSNGAVVGWAGRSLDETRPKYINSSTNPYFHKQEILFNYNVAKNYSSIYVVEGFMDALSLITAGVENVVALMGCKMSQPQLELLSGKQIFLFLDNDIAGARATYKLITEHKDIKFFVVQSTLYKDANECLQHLGADGLKTTMANLESGTMFILRMLKQYTDLSSELNQERLWKVLSELLGSREKEYREIYPLNLNYTPVTFNKTWSMFDQIIKEAVK